MQTDTTIILPVKNGEPYLVECLDAIINQKYQGWQLLIIDNCSEDKTAEICAAYASDSRIKYLRNDIDIGPQSNSLKGLRMCNTKYFALISHDDKYISPNAVGDARKILEANQNVAVVYSHMHWIDEKSRKIFTLKFSPVGLVASDQVAKRSIIKCRNLFGVPLLARTELIAGYEPDSRLYYTADIEYSMIMGHKRNIYVLDTCCYAIRFHKSNNTMRNYKHIRGELEYMAAKHGSHLSLRERILMHINNWWMMAQKFCFFIYLDYLRR